MTLKRKSKTELMKPMSIANVDGLGIPLFDDSIKMFGNDSYRFAKFGLIFSFKKTDSFWKNHG